MPRGDGTGPMGMGPMTGRAAGYCSGSGVPGYANSIPGRGLGMGFGRGFGGGRRGFGGGGRGWRNMSYSAGLPSGYPTPVGYPISYQNPDPAIESQMLKNQADALQSELDLIKKRLAEIEDRNTTG